MLQPGTDIIVTTAKRQPRLRWAKARHREDGGQKPGVRWAKALAVQPQDAPANLSTERGSSTENPTGAGVGAGPEREHAQLVQCRTAAHLQSHLCIMPRLGTLLQPRDRSTDLP